MSTPPRIRAGRPSTPKNCVEHIEAHMPVLREAVEAAEDPRTPQAAAAAARQDAARYARTIAQTAEDLARTLTRCQRD